MRPFDGFLDLDRIDPMTGNMADIVHIPLEAFAPSGHNSSIYNYCIYRQRRSMSDALRADEVYVTRDAAT